MSEGAGERLDRRSFGQFLAGTAGCLVGVGADRALTAVQAAEPEVSSAILRLADAIQLCPGEHWTEDVQRLVLGDIEGDLSRARVLKRAINDESDEPATVFRSVLPRSVDRPGNGT